MNKEIEINNSRTCIARYCNNIATRFMKVAYLNKNGWFCENCAKELSKEGLIKEEVSH